MALILNDTNRYANGALTATIDTGLGCSYAVTFKTGATVKGVRQVIACLNVAAGNFRGMSIAIRTDGIFAAVVNGLGSDADGIAPYSNVTAQPNATYRAVLVRSTTHITLYINAIGNTYTRTTSLAAVITRIHHGGKYSGTTFNEPFTGKIVRSAFWPSILSNADITVCLDQLQTPANCSVAPQDYWLAIANDSPTNGSNSLVRINGAVYDADTLSAPSISSITNPIAVGGTFSFMGGAWVNGTFTSITSNVTGATVSSITGNTTSGGATVAGWVNGQTYAETPCAITLTFDDGSGTDTEASVLNPQAGYTKVPIAAPIVNTLGYLAGDIKDQTGRTIVTGDRIYHTVPEGMPDLEIDPDTWYSVTNAGTFGLWLWVSSGVDAGKMFYYSVTITESGAVIEDTNPDAFTFGSVSGVNPSAVVPAASSVTVTGVTAGVNISAVATGGLEYRVSTDGGSTFGTWTAATTSVQLGYVIEARFTASGSYSTPVVGTLTVGGVAGTLTVTTRASNGIPDRLIFASALNTELLSEHISDTETVTGMDVGESSAFTVANGTYSKNGGAFISTAGTLENGDTFALRGTSDEYFGRSKTVTLTATNGSVESTFTIVNKLDPLLPASIGGNSQLSGRKITGRKI